MHSGYSTLTKVHHVQPESIPREERQRQVDPQGPTLKTKTSNFQPTAVLRHSPHSFSTWSSSSDGNENAPRLYPKVKERRPRSQKAENRRASRSSSRRHASRRHGSRERSSSENRRRGSASQRRRSSDRHGSSKPTSHKKQSSSHATSTTRASSTQSIVSGADRGDDCHYRAVATEADLVAEKVRALPDLLEEAWNQLVLEYTVQTRIWDSLDVVRKGMADGGTQTKDPCKAVRGRLDSIFEQYAMEDVTEALERLEEMVMEERYTSLMSSTFEAAGEAVIKAESVMSRRQQLIDYLEEDDDEELEDADVADLEKLLLECQLQDCKLEYRVRQVLRLGLRSAIHHKIPEDYESQFLFIKKVRFDLTEYTDEPKNESTRQSDGVFVHDSGIVCL